MSYQKYYGRQFIDLQNGTHLPLVLWGSNNCTEFVNGRKVFERHWTTFGPVETPAVEEFMRWIYKNAEKEPEYEVWMNGSKWVCWKNIPRWATNGYRDAATIEEIYEKTGKRLSVSLIKGYGREAIEVKSVNAVTTAEILKFFDFVDNMPKDERAKCHIYYDFGTREPLKMKQGFAQLPNIPFAVKVGRKYLMKFNINEHGIVGYTLTPRRSEACIFKDKGVYDKYLSKFNPAFGVVSFVSADKVESKKEFVVRVTTNRDDKFFISGRTKWRLSFTNNPTEAMRFSAIKEAEKWANKSLFAFALKGWEVEKYEDTHNHNYIND